MRDQFVLASSGFAASQQQATHRRRPRELVGAMAETDADLTDHTHMRTRLQGFY